MEEVREYGGFSLGEKVRIREGAFIGKSAKVEVFAPDVPKSIGVRLVDLGEEASKVNVVWCRPDELEMEKP